MTKSLMFEGPRENEFTQGTVFSCAYAEDYQEASVYGLVVTARCDAAQDKTPIFSYIPVVSIHDWMLGDGANIVMDRLGSECQSVLRSEEAEQIILTVDHDHVDVTSNLIARLIREKQSAPMRYRM